MFAKPGSINPFTNRGLLALTTALVVGIGTWAQPVADSAVKAALIRRFPEFVEWQADALPKDGSVAVCLSASQPFGSMVQEMAKDVTIRGRALTVRALRKGERPDGCHVLYVAAADRDLLREVQRLPVLTVGDQPEFCQLGGIVNFRVIAGRVRFEVNVTQARRVGLKLDSQFLRLAIVLLGEQP